MGNTEILPLPLKLKIPLGEVRNTSAHLIIQAKGFTWEADFPVIMPPLVVIGVKQEGEVVTDGLWDYLTDMKYVSGDIYFQGRYVSYRAYLKLPKYPEALDDSVELDATKSFSPTSALEVVEWLRYPYSFGVKYAAINQIQTVANFSEGVPNAMFTLAVKAVDGGIAAFNTGVKLIEGAENTGPLDHPNGALLIPTKRDAGGTKILRFNEGVSPETIAELPTEKGVHLMRHGGTLWKGNAARQLATSENDGEEWTVISNAFPSDYKTISWTATAPDGGFVAIATKDKRLYAATSFDGRNWSQPLQIFGNGTRNVSRAQIKQMHASGESHLLVSDGTFTVRSDDYFKTAGTVLLS